MWPSRRRLRRCAAWVLLLWLFGVGASVAHACLVSAAWDGEGTVAAHATPLDRHDDDDYHGGPGKANCKDFCQKSSALTPTSKSVFDIPDPGAEPIPPSFALLPAAQEAGASWHALPDRQGTPPVHIAFLRLTL